MTGQCPVCGRFNAAHRFWVDWEDDHYPRIRVWDFGDYPYAPERLTLAEAKAEIIRKFEDVAEHARNRIREARAVRASDFVKDGAA